MLVLVKHLKINQPPLNNKCNEIRKQSEICTGTTKGDNRLKLLFAALTPDFDDNLQIFADILLSQPIYPGTIVNRDTVICLGKYIG